MTKGNKAAFLSKMLGVLIFFGAIFYSVYSLTAKGSELATEAQQLIYPIGFAALVAGLAAVWLIKQLGLLGEDQPYSKFYFPVFSALLALVCMSLAYTYLGMWPVGTKSAMLVDMHHQYAPLLAQLRDTLLHGDSLLYSFDLGLGASYLPLAGYYLASPLNFILLLFPANLLDTAILVITLIKNCLCAFTFAIAVQYIYGKRSYAIPAVSIMYSMMMYMISYSWNLMWLDVVMMLPLAVMGFEMMMREKKPLLYVLSLAYALFTNYYIAFMLCVFLVLYYFFYMFREHHTVKEMTGSFLNFGFFSVLAAMLAGIMVVPIALSLGDTSAAGGGLNATWNTNFDLWDLLGRHLYDVEPTIRSGNLPNIYCGILTVVLVPLFLTNKAISPRRRGGLGGLFAVMAASLVVNNLDLMWHGLHAPNDLPYRFSFLYSFVLLLMAYEVLINIKEVTGKQIVMTIIGLVAYVIVEQKFGDETYEFKTLGISLGFAVLYAIVLTVLRSKKFVHDAGYALLLTVVVVEMVTGTGKTLVQMNGNEYFTQHFDYTDNAITKTVTSAVNEMEKLGDQATDNGFYRVEFLPRRTCTDTALFDYNGITVFASSNKYEETRFMGGMGYAVNGVNSFLYHFFTPFADSILGLRYVAMTDEFTAPSQLNQKMNVSLDGNKYTIYENRDALSLGFMVDNNVQFWAYDYYNPVTTNNSLASSMSGIGGDIYECQTVVATSGDGSVSGSYSVSVPNGTSNYKATITEPGRYYVFVDCRAAKNIGVTANYTSRSDSDYWSMGANEPYFIDAGQMEVGDDVDISINSTSSCGGNVFVCRLNEEVYANVMNQLKSNQMKVTTFTDTKIAGDITASKNGILYTSVPYDAGWTVKVDGKKVDTMMIGSAMLGIELDAGMHNITMTFCPRGFVVGVICTVLAILILVLLAVLKKHPEWTEAIGKKLKSFRKNLRKKKAVSNSEEPVKADEKEEDSDLDDRPPLASKASVPEFLQEPQQVNLELGTKKSEATENQAEETTEEKTGETEE